MFLNSLDGEEEAPIKKAEKAKKTFINKSLIREMQEELLDTPVEIHNRGDSYSFDHQRKAKEKQRYTIRAVENIIFIITFSICFKTN